MASGGATCFIEWTTRKGSYLMDSVQKPRLRRHRRRLASGLAALLIGAAGAASLPAPAGAQTGNVVTLETTAYKITNLKVGAGSRIPTGTVLTPVVLRTVDPDEGPRSTGSYTDPTRLSVGEQVTISVDGTRVATTFPGSRPVGLSTAGGSFVGTVFTAGRDSYVIPRRGTVVSGPVTLTASATANNFTGQLNASDFGPLLPVAQRVIGTVLYESSTLPGIATAGSAGLYDSDGIRGTNPGEEWLGAESPFQGQEVLVTVQFDDGSFATVRGLQRTIFRSYGSRSSTTLLETAALGGRSLGDVDRIVSSVATDHDLNWADLGFAG